MNQATTKKSFKIKIRRNNVLKGDFLRVTLNGLDLSKKQFSVYIPYREKDIDLWRSYFLDKTVVEILSAIKRSPNLDMPVGIVAFGTWLYGKMLDLLITKEKVRREVYELTVLKYEEYLTESNEADRAKIISELAGPVEKHLIGYMHEVTQLMCLEDVIANFLKVREDINPEEA